MTRLKVLAGMGLVALGITLVALDTGLASLGPEPGNCKVVGDFTLFSSLVKLRSVPHCP